MGVVFIIISLLIGGLFGYFLVIGLLSKGRLKQVQAGLTSEYRVNEEKSRGILETEKSLHEKTREQLAVMEARLKEADTRTETLRDKIILLEKDNSSLTEKSKAQELYHKEQISLLQNARTELTKDFENISNQIFNTTTERLNSHNRESINQMLEPLKTQIKGFRERVDVVYDKEARDRQALYNEISNLKELNKRINDEAANLTKALKGDSQKQGAWGEVVLERLLEESGLRKGYEYETQTSFTDAEGRRKRPDVILHLPDEKDIILDSKVSLVGYEQYTSEVDDAEMIKGLKSHVASVRAHIKELALKNYDELEEVRTLDYVLMFIPIESAFMTAIEADKRLFTDAYEKNIIIVSPSTLMVTLRTIQNIWRYERQNANAQEIAEKAGKLYDKFTLFVEALLEVEKHLGNTKGSLDKAFDRLSKGRGNLVRQSETIKTLGAKTKRQIPKRLTDQAD